MKYNDKYDGQNVQTAYAKNYRENVFNTHLNNNISKRNWTYIDTRTITLQIFENWDEFVELSNIENKPDYENIFNTLTGVYGNLFTKANTKEILANRLRYYMEIAFDKYEKQNAMWDLQIERLLGEYAETNSYDIGELQTESTDQNFDQYLIARQTQTKQQDILDKVQQIQELKTPFETLIETIKNKLFIPHQKNKDQIVNIIGDKNGTN